MPSIGELIAGPLILPNPAEFRNSPRDAPSINPTATVNRTTPTPVDAGLPDFAQEGQGGDNVSGWRRFLDRLTSDTAMQRQFLAMGASMLQPRQGGQTQAGAIGAGVLAGVEAKDKFLSDEESSRLAAQNAQSQATIAGAQKTQAETGAAGLEQRTKEFEDLNPQRVLEMQVLTAQLEAANPEGIVAQTNLLVAKAKLEAAKRTGQADFKTLEMVQFLNNELLKGRDPVQAVDAWSKFQLTGKSRGTLFDAKMEIFGFLTTGMANAITEEARQELIARADILQSLAETEFAKDKPAGGGGPRVLDPDPTINARMKEIALQTPTPDGKPVDLNTLTDEDIRQLREQALIQ